MIVTAGASENLSTPCLSTNTCMCFLPLIGMYVFTNDCNILRFICPLCSLPRTCDRAQVTGTHCEHCSLWWLRCHTPAPLSSTFWQQQQQPIGVSKRRSNTPSHVASHHKVRLANATRRQVVRLPHGHAAPLKSKAARTRQVFIRMPPSHCMQFAKYCSTWTRVCQQHHSNHFSTVRRHGSSLGAARLRPICGWQWHSQTVAQPVASSLPLPSTLSESSSHGGRPRLPPAITIPRILTARRMR